MFLFSSCSPPSSSDVSVNYGALHWVFALQVDDRGYCQFRRDVRSQRTVSYNRELLCRYHAHINVDVCASVAVVAYLYKYVFKGADSATVTIRQENAAAGAAAVAAAGGGAAGVAAGAGAAAGYAAAGGGGGGGGGGGQQEEKDELEEWLKVRYTSSSEAAWTAFEYHRTAITPSCEALPVHMPNEDMVPMPADAPDIAELLRKNMAKLDHYRCRPPSGAPCIDAARPDDYFAAHRRVPRDANGRLPFHQEDVQLRQKEREVLQASGLDEVQVGSFCVMHAPGLGVSVFRVSVFLIVSKTFITCFD